MDISQLDSEGWPEIVARLGGSAALAASAFEHEAFRRQRGVRSPTDLLRLAMIYGPGGHSLRVTAGMAAIQGIADISDVALMNRLANAAPWLEALCTQRLAALAPPGGQDLTLRIVDGSRLEGPGRSCWQLHACYDTAAARLCDATITTMKHGERLDILAPRPGELRIGDRGYPRPEGLTNTLKAGAEVLVRLTWKSLRLLDKSSKLLDWKKLFKTAGRSGTIDMPVFVSTPRGPFEPLAMRLVILPKPSVAARRKVRKDSIKGQYRSIDPRTLTAAGYLILITSLEPTAFPAQRLAAIYRLRWQIELAFKRLKSILDIDRLPAKDPGLAKAWLYAHLLFALLIEDVQAELDAFSP
jgi:hypothetical protein